MKKYTAASILLLGVTVAAAPAVHRQSGTGQSGTGQSGKGLSMIMTTTMNMPQFPKPMVMMMAQIRLSSSGKARADWLSTDSAKTPEPHPAAGDRPPILQPGTYSLGRKGGDTTYIVDPTQKKIWIMLKSDNAASMASAQKIVRDEYVNVDVSAQRVQPDTTIAGFSVQHWRVVDNHTTRSHAFGTTNSMIFKANYEFYSAPEFEIAGFSPADMFTGMGGAAADTTYTAKLRSAMVQAMPGYPLMMRTTMQILDNKGKATSVSMAMLVSNISRADPPASIFALPAGYATVRGSLMSATVAPGTAGTAGAAPAGAAPTGAAPAGVPVMPGVGGDTTHASLLDTAAKQSGTDATNNAGQAVKQKLKSVIHFP
jgi:hypothetical protein